MAATPSGKGYWLVASDGGIFCFGDAKFRGSTGGRHLDKPIVGMSATPSGTATGSCASDGGIFCFGDAKFRGSIGRQTPRQADRRHGGDAVRATATGSCASDGGIFSFGDAHYHGSKVHTSAPVCGFAGNGYWMTARDGKVAAFGDRPRPRPRATAVLVP